MERKKRIVLTPKQKLDVVAAYNAGGTLKAVAERFDTSPATIKNIIEQFSDIAPKPEPVELSTIKQLVGMDDVGVLLDGNYIVIRFPKNKVTHALLAGVL